MLRNFLKITALHSSLAIALILPAAASAEPLDPKKVNQPEMTSELALGKLNYEAKCAQCHGRNAVGTDKGPTFLHRVYHPGHHGDRAFYLAARQGARAHHWKFGDMPPVEDVTDKQLQTIVSYIRALQHANGLF